MSEKRFSTDDIVATVMKWRGWDMDATDEPAYREIIARLRAADKLCDAAKLARESQGWDGNDPDEIRWPELYAKLRKAIADYEGKEKL
jgi:hypothetical protein